MFKTVTMAQIQMKTSPVTMMATKTPKALVWQDLAFIKYCSSSLYGLNQFCVPLGLYSRMYIFVSAVNDPAANDKQV